MLGFGMGGGRNDAVHESVYQQPGWDTAWTTTEPTPPTAAPAAFLDPFNRGWFCPKCGRVWAPDVQQCRPCAPATFNPWPWQNMW